MSSVVQIANRALTKLGAARITSLDDDNAQSRAVNSAFEAVRDDELRAHRWSFALKRVSLAAMADAPDHGWGLQYELPTDFLRLDLVDDRYPAVHLADYNESEAQEWVLEGRRILTNLPAPLKVRYLARISDVAQWDVSFREVVACRLAAELAETLTQSNAKRQLAWEEYQRALRAALRANAIERPPVQLPDTAWTLGRL